MITFSEALSQVLLNSMDTRLASGTLVLLSSADAEIATLTLAADNIFTSISGKTGTFDTVTPDSDATGGTVAKFQLITSGSVADISGIVTASGGGGDIIIDNVVIPAGSEIDMSSVSPLTFVCP